MPSCSGSHQQVEGRRREKRFTLQPAEGLPTRRDPDISYSGQWREIIENLGGRVHAICKKTEKKKRERGRKSLPGAETFRGVFLMRKEKEKVKKDAPFKEEGWTHPSRGAKRERMVSPDR